MEKVLTKYDFNQLKGSKGLVVFFYPRALSKDCSIEVQVFNQKYKDITNLGYNVVGISTDKPELNQEFSDEYKLQYPLISDVDHSITTKFGQLTTVVKEGKEIERALRTTFIIDANDKVIATLPKVSAITSATDVIKEIEKLNK